MAVREQAKHVALSRRQAELAGGSRADEDVGERRIDVHPARADRLERAHELVERRVLEHEPSRAGVERLGQKRSVAESGVHDARALRRRARDLADHGRTGDERHAQVEHGERGTLRLDERDRLLAVARPADDTESLQVEEARDALEDRGMVVGDDAGGLGRSGAHVPVVGRRRAKLRDSQNAWPS